jgi:eukaryotic-like serine/threonine-protein kinase
MNSSQRHRRVSEIYDRAVELDPLERKAYLDEACAGDLALRTEVEALVLADAQASPDFIETPALNLLARSLAAETTWCHTRTIAGRFRLVSLLGMGGMGEVYLAEDSSLRRRVAVKLLPECFSRDVYRLECFQREAIAASALNHPNILTVYEIGWDGGQPFIITEFVEGNSLRQLIEEGLPLRSSLDVVAQVSHALAVAHAHGIVHRDLKPENIMVRPDGLVKVLDFGLAQLTESATDPGRGRETSPPEDTRHIPEAVEDVGTGEKAETLVGPGNLEGTIHYMSPEQAQGKPVDHRTDIFSLGVILYELVGGRRPFEGNSEAAVRAAILVHRPKPVSAVSPKTPVGLDRAIKRALAKDPGDRYRRMSELSRDLAALSGRTNSRHERTYPATGGLSRGARLLLLALMAAAVLATGGLLYRMDLSPDGEEPLFKVRDATFSPLTTMPGAELYPSLLPDGRLLYAAELEEEWTLFLREAGGDSVNLTEGLAGGASHPAPSPDGRAIAFWSPGLGGIHLLELESLSVRQLSPDGHNPAWSPDGLRVVYATGSFSGPGARGGFPSSLWSVDVESGDRRLISDNDAVQPKWSPHGYRIAYWGLGGGGRRDIWTISAHGGEPVAVTDDRALDWNPVWSPDGRHLYYVSDRSGSMNLWRLRIDELTGEVLSDPEPITLPAVTAGYIAFSQDGARLVYVEDFNRTAVYEFDFDPLKGDVVGEPREIPSSSMVATNADLSPDRDWFVHDAIGATREALFLLARDGSGRRRITDGAYRDRAPRWHPNGDRILFFSDRSGRFEVWTAQPDGGDLRQLSATEGPQAQVSLWSPDGTRVVSNLQWGPPVLFSAASPTQRRSLTPQSGKPLSSPMLMWSWSPDGRKLAGWGERIFIYDFAEERYEQLAEAGMRPVWLPDSRRLLFFLRDRLYLHETATRTTREILSVAPLEFQSLGLSRDGKLVFASLASIEADIWLASPSAFE